PWCIAGFGDNPTIIDVLMVNPYQGVDFGTQAGGQRTGRHFIRNLFGQPLRTGIYINGCLDIGRIENVHFWPFWMDDSYTSKYGEAFVFGKADWHYVFNTFTYGYNVGYKFIQTSDGVCNGNFLGIGADGSHTAILVEQCSPLGLLITNGEFSSFSGDSPNEVVTGPDFTGTIQFQNCAFWGSAKNIGFLQGNGAVSFQNCNFVRWSYHEAPQPALDVWGGELSVVGCRFRTTGPQLHLREDVKQAVVTGNLSRAPELIVNESLGQVVLNSNVHAEFPQEEKHAVVVDNAMMEGSCIQGAFEGGAGWKMYAGGGSYLGSTAWAPAGQGEFTATWKPSLKRSGKYEVFVWYGDEKAEAKNATNAEFAVTHSERSWISWIQTTSKVTVDMSDNNRRWVSLGTWRFQRNIAAQVQLTNEADGRVLADAVKFVRQ
ncbi:MAG TPA: hypothetical protein PKH07_14005, partial [bacterium]|nr:hypothetical protein [bacterium]